MTGSLQQHHYLVNVVVVVSPSTIVANFYVDFWLLDCFFGSFLHTLCMENYVSECTPPNKLNLPTTHSWYLPSG